MESENHSVLVTGKVHDYNSLRREEGFEFEVELPYEDISQDSMPIHESNELIFSAINRKYGTGFFQSRDSFNPLLIKKKK